MPDYEKMRDLCIKGGKVSSSVVDEFLVYYAASRDKLADEFDARIARFKDALKELPSNWTGLLKSQYIVHRIFKKQGLISRYINHAAIKELGVEQKNYLRQMASQPWRFSFSEIVTTPARDFYEMEDVFTGERYLLHSPSVGRILSERPVLLWFNLIGFNGECWETFGPVSGFQSFDADDIFFYATELNGSIASETDLLKDVESNPVPYMMLLTGSTYPLIQNQGFEFIQVVGESHLQKFDMQPLKNEFRIEYAEGVFKLTHELWSDPPHFAEAYFDEGRKTVLLFASTDSGYLELAKRLNTYGFTVQLEPDVRLHLPMLTVIEKLHNKKIEVNPYAELFEIKKSPADDALMTKLNELLSRTLPYINAGKEPDIDALAKEVGVDPEIARDLFQKSSKRIRELRKGKP